MKTLTIEALLGLCLVAALTGCTESRAEPAPANPVTGSENQTHADSAPPVVAPAASADAVLPEILQAGHALQDVVRLLRAGVEESVLLTHIRQSKQPFDIGTEEILYLTDLGASGAIINAMMARDSELAGTTSPAMTEPATTSVNPASETAVDATSGEPFAESEITEPPAEAVTVDYFHDYLAPYGVWVDIAGYGRCWQPTVAVTTSGWMPYADAGRWLYTDYGWYWYSDYTWGWAPFHYGRWFHHSSYGWCWSPGTVWGPSWVTWRITGEYAGWAPLPPSSFISVSIGVSWSAPYYWYTYVPSYRICHPHPRHCAVPYSRSEYLHKQARPCNRYEVARDNTIVNRGLDPDELGTGGSITRTRLERTGARPQPLRRGETFDAGTGLVRSIQPVRGPTRGESTRATPANPAGPTRQVPTSVRTTDRDMPENALVMRGVPRSTSDTDATRPARRTPSATEERGSYFSARVPPGSTAQTGSEASSRSAPTRRDPYERAREPAPAETASRPSVTVPGRGEQPVRPVSVGRQPPTAPVSAPTARSVPTRIPDTAVSSRTSPTTVRSLPPSSPNITRSTPTAPTRSTSVRSSRDLPSARATPFTVPSRSVPSTVRPSAPTRTPLEPASRGAMTSTPSIPSRSAPSASPTRFSPYSPAASTVRTPPARSFTAPAQPVRSAPPAVSPPAVSRQPPAVSPTPAPPSRSAPVAPARDRSSGRSGRDR